MAVRADLVECPISVTSQHSSYTEAIRSFEADFFAWVNRNRGKRKARLAVSEIDGRCSLDGRRSGVITRVESLSSDEPVRMGHPNGATSSSTSSRYGRHGCYRSQGTGLDGESRRVDRRSSSKSQQHLYGNFSADVNPYHEEGLELTLCQYLEFKYPNLLPSEMVDTALRVASMTPPDPESLKRAIHIVQKRSDHVCRENSLSYSRLGLAMDMRCGNRMSVSTLKHLTSNNSAYVTPCVQYLYMAMYNRHMEARQMRNMCTRFDDRSWDGLIYAMHLLRDTQLERCMLRYNKLAVPSTFVCSSPGVHEVFALVNLIQILDPFDRCVLLACLVNRYYTEDSTCMEKGTHSERVLSSAHKYLYHVECGCDAWCSRHRVLRSKRRTRVSPGVLEMRHALLVKALENRVECLSPSAISVGPRAYVWNKADCTVHILCKLSAVTFSYREILVQMWVGVLQGDHPLPGDFYSKKRLLYTVDALLRKHMKDLSVMSLFVEAAARVRPLIPTVEASKVVEFVIQCTDVAASSSCLNLMDDYMAGKLPSCDSTGGALWIVRPLIHSSLGIPTPDVGCYV